MIAGKWDQTWNWISFTVDNSTEKKCFEATIIECTTIEEKVCGV